MRELYTLAKYFFDGVSATHEEVMREASAEDLHSLPFLNFVSHGQSIQLNSFLSQVDDRKIRWDVLPMIEGIASVSAD